MTEIQVQFTIDDEQAGIAIADALLAQRLVACVQQIGPISSRYWWQGQREEAAEWLFLAKTTSGHVDAVVDSIEQRHPYDVPEIIATQIVAGLAPYLAWIYTETSG